MKTPFTLALAVWMFTSVISLSSAAEPDVEELRKIVRESAAKIEKALQDKQPEAKGLVERVERTLAAKKAAEPDEPRQRLAAEMHLMSLGFSSGFAWGGVRGVRPKSTTDRVTRFRKLIESPSAGLEEVRRCMELGDLADDLDWDNAQEHWETRSIEVARALVAAEPRNAEAMTLLAWAISWHHKHDAESIGLLRQALELDPAQLTASMMLLNRRFGKAVESAALRREVPLEEKDHEDILRVLFEKPLNDTETAALEKKFAELDAERRKLLDEAVAKGRTADYFNLLQARSHFADLERVKLTRERDDSTSLEEIREESSRTVWGMFFSLLDDPDTARQALKVAQEDALIVSSIYNLLKLRQFNSEEELDEKVSQVMQEVEERMRELAKSRDEGTAATAQEELQAMNLIEAWADEKDTSWTNVIDLVRAGPMRVRRIELLFSVCAHMEEKGHASSRALSHALADVQCALVPCLPTRKLASASAARDGFFDRALDLLDDCDVEKSGDLALLNQRIATLMRQDASVKSVANAWKLYGEISGGNVLEKTAEMDSDDRNIFLQNFVIMQALSGDFDGANRLLAEAHDAEALEDETYEETRNAVSDYRKEISKTKKEPSKKF